MPVSRRQLNHALLLCIAFRYLRTMKWRLHIESDSEILRGKPCIKGTRIPVALILGYLAAGRDTPGILREFPDLKASDVSACLDYARDLAGFETVPA